MSRPTILLLFVLSTTLAILLWWWLRIPSQPERASVESRLQEFGPLVEQRLRADFAKAGQPYPPRELAFLAFKEERLLQVYSRVSLNDEWRFIKHYPILAASGKLGPKLREGDFQVPEGIYRYDYLNPNSRFHLSLHLNYPNEFDRAMAQREGRNEPGTNIMIHGAAVSAGCLAMGDAAVEDLFVLAALVGPERLLVIISPHDLRQKPAPSLSESAPWVDQLYVQLQNALASFAQAQSS